MTFISGIVKENTSSDALVWDSVVWLTKWYFEEDRLVLCSLKIHKRNLKLMYNIFKNIKHYIQSNDMLKTKSPWHMLANVVWHYILSL